MRSYTIQKSHLQTNLLFGISYAILIMEAEEEVKGSCTGKHQQWKAFQKEQLLGKVRQLSQMLLYGGLDIIRGIGPKISPRCENIPHRICPNRLPFLKLKKTSLIIRKKFRLISATIRGIFICGKAIKK